MIELKEFFSLLVALILGLAVGIEREHWGLEKAKEGRISFGGVRTYALVSLLGYLLGFLSSKEGTLWFSLGGFLILGFLSIAAYIKDVAAAGITSEISFLITYLTGVLCAYEMLFFAVIVAVFNLFLLSVKPFFKKWILQLSQEEILSTAQFALLSLVILPVLPIYVPIPEEIQKKFPWFPFFLLNPKEIWIMVVLVIGLNFFGYVLHRIYKEKKRAFFLTSFAGGLVSSTALTLHFSKRLQKNPHPYLGLGIILACSVMFPRVLVEVSIFNPSLAKKLALPLLGSFLGGILFLLYRYFQIQKKTPSIRYTLENPVNLKEGISFGILYLIIRLLAFLGNYFFGALGIYLTALFSGISYVHAISLSIAQEAGKTITLSTGGYAIFIATSVNTIIKALILLQIAPKEVALSLLPGFFSMLFVGGVLLIFF